MKESLLRVSGIVLLAGVMALTGCGDRKKNSRDDLADAGYQLTEQDWFRAAENDDTAAMGKFLSGGIAINSKNSEGNTALHVAAAAGAEKSAKFLLDRKMAVDEPGAGGRTPLMEAIRAGKTSMVKWLLRQGADPKVKDAEGYKALMVAVREGRAEVIGDLAAVDREDLDGALLVASLLGKTQVIDELTKYGASVYARMDDGRTALMVAAENGQTESAKLLMEIGANRFTKDAEGRTAADFATLGGHAELAEMLSKEASKDEMVLKSEGQIGEEMEAYVEEVDGAGGEGGHHSTSQSRGGSTGASAGPRTSGRPHGAVTTPAALEGQSLGAPQPTAKSEAAEDRPAAKPSGSSGLVMRDYRQRELPVEVSRVEGTTARLQIRGVRGSEVRVSEGEAIPGTRLKVVRMQRRFQSSKDSSDAPAEVSTVEVEDTTTGSRRSLVVGSPSSAHDPMALVEDAATGKRYLAKPGQTFTGGDGARYSIADVRPNQIVIENLDTGKVQTLPLRGPRG